MNGLNKVVDSAEKMQNGFHHESSAQDFSSSKHMSHRRQRHIDLIQNFVKQHGGARVIQKVLIANNGIAAVKAIRSIRNWVYETVGYERAVEFVVMATPEDVSANAEYVRMADHMVPVQGGSNKNNYANVRLITEIAVENLCDGVWAGWGHASENPQLPRRLRELGIAFLGPGPEAMYALGDKIASTLIAQTAGVPCAPWSGDGLCVDYKEHGCIPEDILRSACVSSPEEAMKCADRIGYPVMIKASEGGGGKGIRMASSPEHIQAAFRQVAGEVAGSPIFVMKVLSNARHLEVQLVADEHDNAIALYGRDCSVQRRHQKIIEEGPVVAAVPEIFAELERAAVRLAKEVGYVGAGTVEYLYREGTDGSPPEFSFLELNPRLQVEHPVTEWVTGINLPALQLCIAMGIPLGALAPIRRLFNQASPDQSILHESSSSLHSFSSSNLSVHSPIVPIDVSDLSKRVPPLGHVIACRITAENPEEGFQPTSGDIQELTFRNSPRVWGYFSVGAHGSVHEFADSQFGHVFAFGATRDAARQTMVLSLKELSIRGEIHTTVEYLITLLERQDFKKNRINTSWLDGLIAEKIPSEKPSSSLAVIAGAICRAYADFEGAKAEFISCLDRGQLPSLDRSLIQFPVELILNDLKYNVTVRRTAPKEISVVINGNAVQVEFHPLVDSGILMLVGGRSHVAYAREFPSGLRLTLDGKTCLFQKEYDPTRLVSTVNGKLVRFLVIDGEHVQKGVPYVEIEVMKMYLTLQIPESGTIRFRKPEGSVIQSGELLAELELDEPGKVKRAVLFSGELDADIQALMQLREKAYVEPHKKFKHVLEQVHLLLSGFQQDPSCVSQLLDLLLEPSVAYAVLQDALATLVGRLPRGLFELLDEELQQGMKQFEAVSQESAPINDHLKAESSRLLRMIDQFVQDKVVPSERENVIESLLPVRTVLSRYAAMDTVAPVIVTSLLEKYLYTEKPFSTGKRPQDVLFDMRDSHRAELAKVVDLAVSHMQLPRKNAVVLAMLEYLDQHETSLMYTPLKACLHDLSQFSAKADYGDIALRARLMLAHAGRPQFSKRRNDLMVSLKAVCDAGEQGDILTRRELMYRISRSQESMLDVLTSFMLPPKNRPSSPSKTQGNGVHKRGPSFDLIALRPALDDVADGLDDFSRASLRLVATEAHILRSFRAYEVYDLVVESRPEDAVLVAMWRFHYAQSASFGRGLSGNHMAAALGATGALQGVAGLESFDSADNLASYDSQLVLRVGMLAVFGSWSEMEKGIDSVVRTFAENPDIMSTASINVNVLCVVVRWDGSSSVEGFARSEEAVVAMVRKFLLSSHERKDLFLMAGVKMVTYIIAPDTYSGNAYPGFYTFRVLNDFEEDLIYRHIDPSMAFQLELSRLVNFDISRFEYPNRAVNVFFAQDKKSSSSATVKDTDSRFFVRAVVRQADIFTSPSEVFVAIPEAERLFSEALDALEVGRFDRRFRRTDFNHIFLNVIPVLDIDVEDVEAICRRIFLRYVSRCWKLRVFAVEVKVVARKPSTGAPVPLRFLLFNPTGHVLRVEGYLEQVDAITGMLRLVSIDKEHHGHMHGCPVLEPYKPMDRLQRNRVVAQSMETTYVYDFSHLFVKELQERWRKYSQARLLGGFRRHKIPLRLLDSVELIINDDTGHLVETFRPMGTNIISMVAWRYTIYTPEYPTGRDLIVIANDITCMSGSFGPKEDELFQAASKLARQEGIPRIFLATNSGARIGLAEEVRRLFRVEWNDEDDPLKGFKALTLDEKDVDALKETNSVVTKFNSTTGSYLIESIVGSETGLNVENLVGSGMIAGETSAAYDSTFTLTYVTARSVGIGAYLVRLGQRVIQKESAAPIILTGHAALNKVLGREVYVTNEQLGGVKVMYPNGVTHLVVKDDVEGVGSILDWLSYVPRKVGERLPIIESMDPINRKIDVIPGSSPYDPRCLLGGCDSDSDDGKFLYGFFDRGSWKETLGGWARTVVTGRARLGGIPAGVIAVETRSVEKIVPADPASPDTRETVQVQAGQVWYPDSAEKTAQAIRDFDREGLPLFIFANWRGFSGGMRDMFDEILKAGSYIVDALRVYKQPVLVYIPPGGELRGGAWVVVDTQINPDRIEMYADTTSRGGVLEPEGTVEVKYRNRDLIKTMHRLDGELIRLDQELMGKAAGGDHAGMLLLSDERKRALRDAISAREQKLLPVYKQIAIAFADLHDTPQRMLIKRAIRKIIPWQESREFFFWRLQRLLAECRLEKMCKDANPTLTTKDIRGLIRRWTEMVDEVFDYDDDQAMFEWLEDEFEKSIERRVEKLRQEHIAKQTRELGQVSVDGFLDGVEELLRVMDKKQKDEFIRSLQERVSAAGEAMAATKRSGGLLSGSSGFLSHFRWDRSGSGGSSSSAAVATASGNQTQRVGNPFSRSQESSGPSAQKGTDQSMASDTAAPI